MIQALISALSNLWYLLWIYIPGWILTLVSRILVVILSYNGYANETIIDRGWQVTRDLSNMLFIVILLVIALGTILRSGRYGYQQNLRRLIIMAILINFSKSIALFIIDFSQAITIAFANAFLNSLQAGFPQMLGLTPVLQLVSRPGADSQINGGITVFVQIMLGGLMMVVALIVVIIITIIFLFRIIAFAFIIILAPIAFLLSAWPTGFTYYQRWWKELGNYAAVGPSLAFFLWLSFSVVQPQQANQPPVDGCLSNQISGQNQISDKSINFQDPTLSNQIVNQSNIQSTNGASSGGCPALPDNPLAATLLRFLVGIALLIGGLTVAKELGVAGGAMANQWSGKMTNFGKTAALGIGAGLGWAALSGTKGLASGVGGFADRKMGGRLTAWKGDIANNLKKSAETDVGRAARRVGSIAKYASGGFVYDQISQKVVPAYRQMRSAQVTNEMKQMGSLKNNELEREMGNMNASRARAASMLLDKRGHFDVNADIEKGTKQYNDELEKKQALRGKAARVMGAAGAGDPVNDHYKEFQKKYPELEAKKAANEEGGIKKISEKMASINTAGDFEKFAAHWDWSPKMMTAARSKEGGITDKQLETVAAKMTKNEKVGYGQAIRGTIAELEKRGDPESMKESVKLRALGAKVDSKNIVNYATKDLSKNLKIGEADNVRVPLADLVGKMTPEQASAIDIESIDQVAPHMTSTQFMHMARNSDVAKVEKAKKAALEALSDTIAAQNGLSSAQEKLATTLQKGDWISNINAPQAASDIVDEYISRDKKDKNILRPSEPIQPTATSTASAAQPQEPAARRPGVVNPTDDAADQARRSGTETPEDNEAPRRPGVGNPGGES